MHVQLTIDPGVYSLDDVTRAAYWFTAEFHVRIEQPTPTELRVTLWSRGTESACSGASASEFERRFDTALVEERLRRLVTAETAVMRERIWSAALAEASPRKG